MTRNYYLKKHGLFLEDLKIGQVANYKKKISEKEINIFADITGDNNPVHLDEKFARFSIFKKRIAHGFLTGSLISTVIATKLPGPGSIYLNQSLKFLAPVFIGDIVNAQVTINDIQIENKKVILLT
jgi:3-hydroxybutyryl-CoA dehydratase